MDINSKFVQVDVGAYERASLPVPPASVPYVQYGFLGDN